MRPETLAGDTAKFDLALGIEETPRGLVADWQYRSELFEAATIGDVHHRVSWMPSVALLLRLGHPEPACRSAVEPTACC